MPKSEFSEFQIVSTIKQVEGGRQVKDAWATLVKPLTITHCGPRPLPVEVHTNSINSPTYVSSG